MLWSTVDLKAFIYFITMFLLCVCVYVCTRKMKYEAVSQSQLAQYGLYTYSVRMETVSAVPCPSLSHWTFSGPVHFLTLPIMYNSGVSKVSVQE